MICLCHIQVKSKYFFPPAFTGSWEWFSNSAVPGLDYLAQRHLNKLDACSHKVLRLCLPAEGLCPYLLHQPAAYLMWSTDREGSSMLSLSVCLWHHSWPAEALWYVILSCYKKMRDGFITAVKECSSLAVIAVCPAYSCRLVSHGPPQLGNNGLILGSPPFSCTTTNEQIQTQKMSWWISLLLVTYSRWAKCRLCAFLNDRTFFY